MPAVDAWAAFNLIGCIITQPSNAGRDTYFVEHPSLPGSKWSFRIASKVGVAQVYLRTHRQIISHIIFSLNPTTTPSNHDNT
jgi:hypothetical protein